MEAEWVVNKGAAKVYAVAQILLVRLDTASGGQIQQMKNVQVC